MVDQIKQEFNKRKVSLDDFSTIDSIPSAISTFEDIYIPKKDGTPYVDVETFDAGNVDVSRKVEELKYQRDTIVSGLSVPPSFVGVEENLCISLDTKIPFINGSSATLNEIINLFNNNVCLPNVFSCNKNGNIVSGEIIWAGKTRLNTKCIKVILDNNEYLIVTPDHPFEMRDGSYIEAQYLCENNSLMPFYIRDCKNENEGYKEIYNPGTDTWKLLPLQNNFEHQDIFEDTQPIQVCGLNHKVKSIEFLNEKYDTGDITIKHYHNFATSAGVFIHNSNKNALSNENILFARAIINYQKIFVEQIIELISKLLNMINPTLALTYLEDIEITLPAPKTLQYENEARYTSDLVSMIQSLKEVGVPIEYSKKKYLPNIDWVEVKKFEINDKIDSGFEDKKDVEPEY